MRASLGRHGRKSHALCELDTFCAFFVEYAFLHVGTTPSGCAADAPS